MHCICTPYALPMHCLCTAYALPIHCLCTAYALPIHCLCTAYALCIHCLCTAYALPIHCLFNVYAVPMHCPCTAYAPPIHCLCTAYALPMHCLFTAYALPTHCVLTAYALPIHCLFKNALHIFANLQQLTHGILVQASYTPLVIRNRFRGQTSGENQATLNNTHSVRTYTHAVKLLVVITRIELMALGAPNAFFSEVQSKACKQVACVRASFDWPQAFANKQGRLL